MPGYRVPTEVLDRKVERLYDLLRARELVSADTKLILVSGDTVQRRPYRLYLRSQYPDRSDALFTDFLDNGVVGATSQEADRMLEALARTLSIL